MCENGAVVRAHFYGYDPAGNRLAEQIDTAVTGGRFNGLNQLTNTINGGRVRIAGHLTNKPGTVVVGTNAAVMDREHRSFVAYAEVNNGANVIPIAATDFQGHSATNRYQINVASNSVAKTLTYDLNGNLTTVATAGSTQTYAWDAADRLVSITQSGDGTNLASSSSVLTAAQSALPRRMFSPYFCGQG